MLLLRLLFLKKRLIELAYEQAEAAGIVQLNDDLRWLARQRVYGAVADLDRMTAAEDGSWGRVDQESR